MHLEAPVARKLAGLQLSAYAHLGLCGLVGKLLRPIQFAP